MLFDELKKEGSVGPGVSGEEGVALECDDDRVTTKESVMIQQDAESSTGTRPSDSP